MNNEQIEQSIKSALENTSPNNFESIKKAAQESKGVVVPMKNKKWIKIVAIVAAFAIVFGGGFGVVRHQQTKKAITTVSLDVNPSVDFDLNKFNEVVSVNALNADGETILGNMDLVGLDSETAVNALVGSMLTNGYLSDIQNSILVTVESQKDEVAEELQESITSQIEGMLGNLSSGGNVLSQIIPSSMDTTNLEKIAEQYGISIGKANFIEQILGSIEDVDGLDIETLASKTINEISLIAETKGADIASTIMQQGEASVAKYIDENAAQLIAVAEAGIKSLDVDGLKITKSDFTYNNGEMCYDVGFEYKNEAFLIEVDASTGVIIDKETGKIGVELEIKDVNVEVNTGNETVDKAVNDVAKQVIDENVNGTTVSGDAQVKEIKSNEDGSKTIKGETEIAGQKIEGEITLDDATIKQVKETAKTIAVEPVMTVLKSNTLTAMVINTLGEDNVRTLVNGAIDNADVNTAEYDGETCYKITTSISALNKEINIYLSQGMEYKGVEVL